MNVKGPNQQRHSSDSLGRAARAIALLAFVLLAACQRAEAAGCTCAEPLSDAPHVALPAAPAPRTTVFLVDRALAPAPPREASYAPSQLTTRAKAVIGELLEQPDLAFSPNDAVFGATISSHSSRPQEVFLPLQAAPAVTPPELRSQLVRPAAPGPLECHGYCDRVMAYNRAAATETSRLSTVATTFIGARDDAMRVFAKNIGRQLADTTFAADGVGTDVWGGLYSAAIVLSRARAASVGALQLVIFSDLVDTVGRDTNLDLRDVTVVIGLYRRDALQDDASGKQEWERRFRAAGAKSVEFVPWNATNGTTIAQALGRP